MKTLQKGLIILFFLLGFIAQGQQNSVIVTAAVLPPYSTDFSYYIDHPDKLVVSFTNATSRQLQVYIQGRLLGDNALLIETDPLYKPPMSITLQPGIPFTLNQSNISDVFSENHLIFTGTSKQELLKMGGLPEGNYQFCFKVFDYNTDTLLSNEQNACSNNFSIQFVDPPVILHPVCADSITAGMPQNILFSWTNAMGASPDVRYRFIMVEMQPDNRNPYDAFASANPNNYFIDKEDLMIPQTLVGPADPHLIEGHNYAFLVQAYDPSGNVLFNNNGTSEICWFHYKSKEPIQIGLPVNNQLAQTIDGDLQSYLDDFQIIPSTKIQGKLLYKLASNAHIDSAGGSVESMESAGKKYVKKKQHNTSDQTFEGISYNQQQQKAGANLNQYSVGYASNFGFSQYHGQQTVNINLSPPMGTGTINADVVDTGGGKPLANTQIRLVARFRLKNSDGFYRAGRLNGITDYNFYDLEGNLINSSRVFAILNKVLDVTTTDQQGNYQFDFRTDFFTGPVIAVSKGTRPSLANYDGIVSLKIEVENQKFCSPDIDIFARPADQLTIPYQVALIKDFEMNLLVKSSYDAFDNYNNTNGQQTEDGQHYFHNQHDVKPKAIAGGDTIPNVYVKVLRDMQRINNEHPAVLLSEGNVHDKTFENNIGKFKVVFEGIASKGSITIQHLVEHWENTDGKNQSPYYFYLSTRSDDPGHNAEQTLYNYEPYFGPIVGTRIQTDSGGPQELDDDAGFTNGEPVVYNHFYTPPHSATKREANLNAAPPEIKGHVMAQTNLENLGVENISVLLLNKKEYKDDKDIMFVYALLNNGDTIPNLVSNKRYHWENMKFTNDAGFFRFKNLPVKLDQANGNRNIGPYRRIQIESKIYKRIVWPPLSIAPYNLKYGELVHRPYQLVPKQMLRGEVVDEDGKSVAAYIKLLPNNPYVKTVRHWEYDNYGNPFSVESFEMPIGDSDNEIEVIPLSTQYFADTISMGIVPSNHFRRIKVFKRLHRLVVRARDIHGNPIPNAKVMVGDSLAYGTTNNKGNVLINFASPGHQFVVKVTADSYAPKQESFNIPVSKSWTSKTFTLDAARFIYGTITESLSHQPVQGAKVYVQLQNTGGHTLYLEAYSDAQGHYLLNGIPNNLSSLDVHVVKDGKSPSYIGTHRVISFNANMQMAQSTPQNYDFQIKAVNDWDLTHIWGFPVQIEKMQIRLIDKSIYISGYFHHLSGSSDFSSLNKNEKIYFNNLRITKGDNQQIKPVQNIIQTTKHSLPISIKGGFEGDLYRPGSPQKPLEVEKTNSGAKLDGTMQLDLSSFRFAYDFHGDFYVGNDTIHKEVTVFRSHLSNANGTQLAQNIALLAPKYYIFDLEGITTFWPVPIQDFKVFGFRASSTFSGSYLSNGKVYINTILHTDIPMSNENQDLDLKINAGVIEITRDDIQMKSRPDNQLDFQLEDWKIKSTNAWHFDKTRDAIVVPNGKIITGLGIEAGIKNLLIRPHALREGDIDISTGLSLGGVKNIQLAQGLQPVFNFDAGVGHYRISMTGDAQGPAGWISNLPATNNRLDFMSIDLLSDNTTEMGVGKTMRFHNLIDVFVDQIMSGDGYFRLAGVPEMGIPGYIATRAEMNYEKKNGHIVFNLQPLSGSVDCNANTVYNLTQQKSAQSLTNKLYTSYGTFYIKPPAGQSGSNVEVKGFLTKTPSDCYIDVIEQDITMGKETMHITNGKIAVVNGAWNELTFEAKTRSKGLDDNNSVQYVVHGGISADSKGVNANNIKTPLGDLNMAYLFDEKALVGDLTIKAPINMGFAALNSGQFATRFDPHGFYLAFCGNVSITGSNYDGGLLLGGYDADLNPVAASILRNFESSPPDLSHLYGIYVIGQRNLINKSFPVVPGVLKASIKAGLGAHILMDFNSNPSVVVGGYGFIYGKCGTNVTGCGFVGFENNLFLEIEGGYGDPHSSGVSSGSSSSSNTFFIRSCGNASFSVGACGLNGTLSVTNRNLFSTAGDHSISLKVGGSCN